MDTDVALFHLAARQHGLLTRAQLASHLSRHRRTHLLRRGRLVPVRPGVYAVAGAPDSWERHVLAAVLAAGPGAAASHRTAAALHRLAVRNAPLLELTVPAGRRVRLDAVRAHRSTCTVADHRTRVAGIPVTDVARTLCDLAAVLLPSELEAALDDALRRRLVSIPRVERVHAELARPGRRRTRVVDALLAARRGGIQPGDSEPERRLVRWLVEAGFPRPAQQYRVRVGQRSYRVDCGYPDLGIDIEYDGWDAHRTRSSFDRDRARGNELEAAGRTVFRFTSASSRREVLRLVGTALAARGALPAPQVRTVGASAPPDPNSGHRAAS
jgi:very-short-patch-repair endonuclease